MGGGEVFVAEPGGDLLGSHAGLQHAHCGGVSEQMWRDGPPTEAGQLLGGSLDQFLDLLKGAEASQRFSVAIGKQRHRWQKSILPNPVAQQTLGLAPQRKPSVLSTFS